MTDRGKVLPFPYPSMGVPPLEPLQDQPANKAARQTEYEARLRAAAVLYQYRAQPARTFGHRLQQAAQERRAAYLQEVYDESCVNDWDGQGAVGVSRTTRDRASRFLSLLPTDLPDPDIGAHPDGAIGFEWDAGSRSRFSVGVPDRGDLAYAITRPGERSFGALQFQRQLPDRLVQLLRSLFARPIGTSSTTGV
jgi:hypothetical protein